MAMLLKASEMVKKGKPELKKLNSYLKQFIKTYIEPIAEKKGYYLEHRSAGTLGEIVGDDIYVVRRISESDYNFYRLLDPPFYGGSYVLRKKGELEKNLALVVNLDEPKVEIWPRYNIHRIFGYEGIIGCEFPWVLSLKNPVESLEICIELYESKIYPEADEGKRRMEAFVF